MIYRNIRISFFFHLLESKNDLVITLFTLYHTVFTHFYELLFFTWQKEHCYTIALVLNCRYLHIQYILLKLTRTLSSYNKYAHSLKDGYFVILVWKS